MGLQMQRFSLLQQYQKSCNNLIFSVHFLNCKYHQHLQSAGLYTETGSHSHFVIAK